MTCPSRPLKRLRTEDDEYKSIILRILGWMFTKQPKFLPPEPKLLPPVPKTQKIITEGNVRIYAGRNVSIANSEFERIVNEGNSFVDKTLLISDFLESFARVSLIVRPRRFGKTTNLTMLKNFFAYPIEPDNKKRRQELFRDSKVWSEKRELFEEHFCKYPVIFIDLQDFRDCRTWALMQEKIRRILAKLYEEHAYVYDGLSLAEKNRFNLIRNESAYPCMVDTLKDLSGYLRNHYGCNCIVLIDECDHPLDVAFRNGFYDKAHNFFSDWLGGLLKDNDLNVYKALLVGVARDLKAGYLSDFMVYTMFDKHFADNFGFTEEEVVMLLNHHEISAEGVKEYYDGYSAANNISLYNPWSIVSFIEKGTLAAHGLILEKTYNDNDEDDDDV